MFVFEIPFVRAAASSFQPLPPSTEVYPGSGTVDASDREYMSKLRELFGFSHKQIDISLTQIAVSDQQKDGVNLLLEDLVSAVKRGVRVRIFINTSGDGPLDRSLFLRDDKLEYLKKTGIEIHFMNPKYRLSDQVVVVDEDKVLEGGPSWTHEDLTEGLGSASLNFSSALAQKKRTRMELLPLWNLKVEKESRTVGELAVPLFLLQDIKYFSGMCDLSINSAASFCCPYIFIGFGESSSEYGPFLPSTT